MPVEFDLVQDGIALITGGVAEGARIVVSAPSPAMPGMLLAVTEDIGPDGAACRGRQRGMIRFFAGHPTIANLLMILFLVAGLFVAPTLLRETFPRAEQNEVEITVPYPGARPEDVESAICERIENALDAVTGIERQSCEAREGSARRVVKKREGEDFQSFVADVKSEIDAITDFPDRAEAARVRPLGQTDFVASIAITGPDTRTDLKDYAEDMRTRMLQWGGIPKVDIRGFSTRELQIGLKPEALHQFGVSVSDIARAVQAGSLDLPAGSIETSTETLLIRIAEERRDVADLAALIVRSSAGGGQVRLGDIAEITERFALDDDVVMFDGRPAAILDINKTRAEDSLRIVDELQAFLAAERQQAPPGVIMEITADAASVVRDRLTLVVVNGLQGLALVFLVLWLFFGFRFSFWVAMGLPVSFMGGVALMGLVGYSLNLMTTLGLLIVIGLVDGRRHRHCRKHRPAARKGAQRDGRGGRGRDAGVSQRAGVVRHDGDDFRLAGVFAGRSWRGSAGRAGGDAVRADDLADRGLSDPAAPPDPQPRGAVEAKRRDGPCRGGGGLDPRKAGGSGWSISPFAGAMRRRGSVSRSCWSRSAMLAGGYLKFTAFPELDGDTIVARVLLPQGTPLSRTEAVVAQAGRRA